MKFGVLVLNGPYQHQASDSAYKFVEAALGKSHEIVGVFFYHDAVINSTSFAEPPSDDRHIPKRWSELAKKHNIDIVVCIAAAKRRGIKNDNLMKGMRISGLGQLMELTLNSDRLVSFGG